AHLHPPLLARLALASARLGTRPPSRPRRLCDRLRRAASPPRLVRFPVRVRLRRALVRRRAHLGGVRAGRPRLQPSRMGSGGRSGGSRGRAPLRPVSVCGRARAARSDPRVHPPDRPPHAPATRTRWDLRRRRVRRRRLTEREVAYGRAGSDLAVARHDLDERARMNWSRSAFRRTEAVRAPWRKAGSGSGRPRSALTAGRTNSSNVTRTDTGLPGRLKTRWSRRTPKATR